MEWGKALFDIAKAGLPFAVSHFIPGHVQRQAQERLGDFNPFRTISANHDLLRATRLAWIEATQEVLKEAERRAEADSRADSNALYAFLHDVSQRLNAVRHEALDRRGDRCEARYYEGEVHAFHAFVFRENARRFWRDTLRQEDPAELTRSATAAFSVPFVDYARGDGRARCAPRRHSSAGRSASSHRYMRALRSRQTGSSLPGSVHDRESSSRRKGERAARRGASSSRISPTAIESCWSRRTTDVRAILHGSQTSSLIRTLL